jgi:uncharacterized protein YndB with AHSA1/START domain
MPVYRTTFAVDAPAACVWEALTALDRYPEWNPQIPRIRGSLRPGERIDLQLALPVRIRCHRVPQRHADSAMTRGPATRRLNAVKAGEVIA